MRGKTKEIFAIFFMCVPFVVVFCDCLVVSSWLDGTVLYIYDEKRRERGWRWHYFSRSLHQAIINWVTNTLGCLAEFVADLGFYMLDNNNAQSKWSFKILSQQKLNEEYEIWVEKARAGHLVDNRGLLSLLIGAFRNGWFISFLFSVSVVPLSSLFAFHLHHLGNF